MMRLLEVVLRDEMEQMRISDDGGRALSTVRMWWQELASYIGTVA